MLRGKAAGKTPARLGRSLGLVVGSGAVIAAIAAIAITALVTWLRHDPKAIAAARERAEILKAPPPRSPEMALKTARDVFTLMAERKFAEALPMTAGPALQLVELELKQQLSGIDRDAKLVRLLNASMAARVTSFEAASSKVSDGGDTVTLQCKATVVFSDVQRSVHPRFVVRWAADHWLVHQLNPDAPP